MRKFFNKGNGSRKHPFAPHYADRTKLQQAVLDNDLGRVETLIRAGVDLNYSGGLTPPPLHLAIREDLQLMALTLLKESRINVNQKDADGYTPLHHAVKRGQEAFVVALLKLGADPNIKDKHGQTPLHLVPRSTPQIIDTLAKYKANMNEHDRGGNTPLHQFIDQPDLTQKLLSNGADPNALNNFHKSPYMMMLDERRFLRNPEIVEKMISLRADLNAFNSLGETILHLSSRLEAEEVFLGAVNRGAKLLTVDSHGESVLHILARTRQATLITQVLERAPELVQIANDFGYTAFHELVRGADDLNFKMDDGYMATALLLINQGAHPDAADRSGRNLVHHAIMQDKMEFLESLLDSQANLTAPDYKGKTPLHYAIERKNLRAMDILLDRGADPDMTDDRGWTILDRLAEKGDRESPRVQRLIVAGGQYHKQLPLHPELIRQPRLLDKGRKYSSDKGKPSGGGNRGLSPPPPGL